MSPCFSLGLEIENNPSLLKTIKGLFTKKENIDFWDCLSQDSRKDILEGIEEIENGEVVDYDDFIKDFR